MIKQDYKTVDRNKLSLLFDELALQRKDFNDVCLTPLKNKSDIEKHYELMDIDKKESFLIMKMAFVKGLLKPGEN